MRKVRLTMISSGDAELLELAAEAYRLAAWRLSACARGELSAAEAQMAAELAEGEAERAGRFLARARKGLVHGVA
jgi:hypothetical protein